MSKKEESKAPRKKQLKGAGRDQFQEFLKFFQDPENASELAKRIRNAAPFDPSYDHSSHGKKRKAKDSDDDSQNNGEPRPYKGPSSKAIAFRALQLHLDYSNQQEVYLAVFYLKKNLPKALEHREEFLSRVVMFKNLAAHLDATEPSLKGVTGMALLSLHERVVAKRKELAETLTSSTLDASQKLEWKNTTLSDAARELVGLDDELNNAYAHKEAGSERRSKKVKTDAKGGSVTSSNNKNDSGSSDESENETLASKKAAASNVKPAVVPSSSADKGKEMKKEKKKDNKKDKNKKEEEHEADHGDATHKTNGASSSISLATTAAALKSSGINETVVEMLLDRIKTLEDEVKELRRKTYDNSDAIKELKWQHVTK